MTSYLNQTIARQQISALISASENGRVRRQFRDARRAARAVRRAERHAAESVENGTGHWAHRLGYA